MIIRKSVDVLPNNATTEKRWKVYQPDILSDLNKSEQIESGNLKGLLKLVLGVLYFISLVFALTILLT
ncbi:MAG: hypothetical protein KJN64_09870 [Ignavibacteria bacterium]|nr:hypothetical protein [Ignavibacteria bacterium]MBT8381670.1 hypothetical protein [Ignavibacteria bacterium]MBT8390337.1 hypothetical protein [Ignavibacteria bacterium]NNJ53058.1 hypothetical protein [Ignavibacteriaceae bacterium]NNL21335.1 hypothetical protein [Ignavibacteriaceae bacterium]